MRVTQVSFVADGERRRGRALLAAWPTLPAVAQAVASAGAHVTVVQPAHADETFRHEDVDYRFVNTSGSGVLDAANILSVLGAVREARPDVVHVQGLNTARAIALLTRSLAGVPVIVQDHGSQAPRGWRRLADRNAFASVAGVIFTAREQALPWIHAGRLSPDVPVFEVMEMSSGFAPGNQVEARASTGMSGNPCLLWTGRLDANKDPLTVLAAFERVAERLPDARLWCCFGDAPLLRAVSERIASSPVLRERVVLLGRRPHAELELRFRAADFFIQASHHEGSGYSVIEALACGTTPIVTDIPSFRTIVGTAGALVPIDDVTSLATAIESWALGDRTAQRARARAQFENRLTLERIGIDLLHAYHAVSRNHGQTAVRRQSHSALKVVARA